MSWLYKTPRHTGGGEGRGDTAEVDGAHGRAGGQVARVLVPSTKRNSWARAGARFGKRVVATRRAQREKGVEKPPKSTKRKAEQAGKSPGVSVPSKSS
jgi:hypothetical protein